MLVKSLTGGIILGALMFIFSFMSQSAHAEDFNKQMPVSLHSTNITVTTYYSGTNDLYGSALKSTLHDIIDDHVEFPYSSSNTDTWDILKETDADPNNPNNVVLFYTGWSVNASQEYNNGNGWNREHTWAKSHGGFTTSTAPGRDVHALRPCDITVNSARGNKDFDNGGTEYIDGDGPTGNYRDADSWEPRPEVKGDVARILFYMSTRYEGDSGELDLELVDYVNSSPSGQPFHGDLDTLLQWHYEDPPSDFERNRNNIIFQYYQGNRNPFIDHPEFVSFIWGGVTEPVSATIQLANGDVQLSWEHAVGSFDSYQVWRSSDYDFAPNDVGSTNIQTIPFASFPVLGDTIAYTDAAMIGGKFYIVVGTTEFEEYESEVLGAFTYVLDASS